LAVKYPTSGARACWLLHLAVNIYYYQSHGRRDETPVRAALRHHAAVRRRWVYPRVTRVLDYVAELRGRPARLITDNEPEFAGLALERWSHDRQVTHLIITPTP
jgi:hypothetical protein